MSSGNEPCAGAGSDGAPRILVVEDSDSLLRLLERMLRRLPCVVVTASTLAEARAACTLENRVALAIVDRSLADGDGLAFIAERRAALGADAPTFIVHTGSGLPEPLPDGVSAVLLKPVLPDLLRATVEAHLAQRARRG